MAVFFLLLAGVFLAPLVLSILAISRANRAIREVEEIRSGGASRVGEKVVKPVTGITPSEEPKPVAAAPRPAPPPLPEKAKPDMEFALGGRVASYVGAAAVILAIAFFVGYAIQRGLIGPLPRVVLSASSAVALLIAGQAFRRKGERHTALAESLTGAGSALLFFTVFAAHRMYGLIDSGLALVALIGSAVGVLLLARRADSQATAVIGTVGAYLTPWLIEPPEQVGLFPLVYVLFINATVLLLYRARPWHALPNIAAFLAVLHLFVSFTPESMGAWKAALLLAAVYAGLAGFNLIASVRSRSGDMRVLDLMRLAAIALAFGVQLANCFEHEGTYYAAGFPLVVTGIAHAIAASRLSRRETAPPEAAAFAHLAALYIAAAIWARFDGLTVAALWGIESMILAALPFSRSRSSLMAHAATLGFLASIGAYAKLDYANVAIPIVRNAHYGMSIALSMLLIMQSRFHARAGSWLFSASMIRWVSISAVILITAAELMRPDQDWSQTAASIWLGLCAFTVTGIGLWKRSKGIRYYGLTLFGIAVVKVFLIDLAGLRGLERAGAFLATGLLLLALSYLYQRLAASLSNANPDS